jgi:uncharacterized protein involved in exopolysaccharide biosynthesis
MILRHRRVIAVVVFLATAISAVYYILAPRQYKAEGFLQVIPPITSIDEKVDQMAFETIIISHLQAIQASFIAREVAEAINKQPGAATKVEITPMDLQKKIKVIRPPKSYLITLEGTYSSPDMATMLVKTWIEKYLFAIRKNNANVALCHVRSLLKKAQVELIENQAKVNQLMSRAEQLKSLVDLSRGINDTQLWREISENVSRDKLNNLSKIHISDQEQSKDFIALKEALYEVDQDFAAAKGSSDFLRGVEKYLEYRAGQVDKRPDSALDTSSNTVEFAETLLNTTDIIELGLPALKYTSKGVLRKTLIAFFASLLLASFAAYLREWFKTIKT